MHLFEKIKEWLENSNYKLEVELKFCYLFRYEKNVVLIDKDFFKDDSFNNNLFYFNYLNEQNKIMYENDKLYRFFISNETELNSAKELLNMLINNITPEFIDNKTRSDRYLSNIDPSNAEFLFENNIDEIYGRETINKIKREYPINDIKGNDRFIDYVIKINDKLIGIEINGESFHNPIIIGKEKYLSQLTKQNSIQLYLDKLYRWSYQSMRNEEYVKDQMLRYLGKKDNIENLNKIYGKRNFSLYKHQEDFLDLIETNRKNGINSHLIVLPTGTGKTEIFLNDLYREFENGKVKNMLALTPTKNLKNQLSESIKNKFQKNIYNFNIVTYSKISRDYLNYSKDYYDYIFIDEAHHCIAPAIKRVLSYFTPKTLLGATATPDRPDLIKLETIFGEYETNLTLEDAIKSKILVPIRVFRLHSNLDLSEIRFNGKDYVGTDLQKSVIVPSRDKLIIDNLKKYFDNDKLRKSGIIFCVSVSHADSLASEMRKYGINAESVSGKDKDSLEKIEKYQKSVCPFTGI